MGKIPLMFFSVLITNCFTLCLSQRGDESALLAFRSHITRDPSRILGNWTANALVCSWAVLWEPLLPIWEISHSTSLDISHNNFSGSIPSELASLRSLRQIFLGSNQLTGTIPSEIFNGIFLETVDMTSNSLSGNLTSGTLSPELSKCMDLEQLSLSSNKFTGSIPRELGFLSKLKVLFIGKNYFTGGVPLEIGNITNLERLNLESCNLIGKIPPSVFNISSLRFINLFQNHLSGSVPQSIDYNLLLLKRLYLSRNELSGEIPPSYMGMQESCESSIENIGNLTSLETLSMINNRLTGVKHENFILSTLFEFAICINSNLRPGEVHSQIANLVKLEGLSWWQQPIWPNSPGILNISSLIYIDMSSNRLSGSLPSSIWMTLSSLEEIYLSNNKFSGKIPSFLFNASSLVIMDHTSNSFACPMPTTSGYLRFLQHLLIAENNLTRESSTPELTFIASLINCRD
ncbi:hypothetical protein M9H77_18332 [Catharanthus roseus]|uniref:Uncharacterized protein n=1 Tax=Catharanthus roseus TaxID=4058 RepID=A0ACC0B749_CATRO|nr:hypothetical protein M9H77_18332 [Catharanthus roseus]